jgi:uncharacterized membrane protein
MSKVTKKSNSLYLLTALASAVGLGASFLQTLDKLQHLKNPTANLICNISSTFNCTNVLDAWQSSFFGFPNSLMCIVFFTLTLGVALAMINANTSKWLRFLMHFLAVFFLGFGAWYLWQSIYFIGSMCIYCLACYVAVIVINATWLRINASDLPLSKATSRFIKGKWDLVLWTLWAFAFVLAIYLKFYK